MSSTNIRLFLFSKPAARWSGKTWRGKPSSNTSSLSACHITLHSDRHFTSKPRTVLRLCLVALCSPHGLPYRLPVERANKTPLRDKHDTDELKEDSATDSQANDAPSWFILGSTPDKVKLEKKLNMTTTANGSNIWEYKKGECLSLDKIGDNLWPFSIARAQAASSAKQNDVFMSTKGTSISSPTKVPGSEAGTNKAGDLPRFWIHSAVASELGEISQLDKAMRKGQGSSTDAGFQALLNSVLALYRYMDDKDVFRMF